ncbi:MAG: glycosyltransferase family 4 protein [Gaiellaceae bacterium]
MRVAIDVSPLRQTRAGTARYLRALLPELERLVDIEPLAWGGARKAATVARDVWWYPLALPRRARTADVLHCPTFRGPLSSRVPLVVTVHDVGVLRRPTAFNRWTRGYSRFFVPRVVRAAARVIAVSEFTKRELVEVVGVREEHVRVVPNGVGEPFVADGQRAAGEYVLAVGTVEPRKNLPRLAEAARAAGVELRVVGERGWGDVSVNVAGVRFLGFVPDEELASLYRGALCFAYPSLYEGFGIPVLEALACGAPVVTSSGTAMAEVVDGAAVLVDPTDSQAIAAGIAEAIRRRDELAPRGRTRAAGFSWRSAAEATASVYRELA